MASCSISEENPGAMAASSSAKVAFNLCSFPTSLFPAALLPLLLLLPAHLPLLALQLPYHILSQVSAATSRKPNHDCHLILVSTAAQYCPHSHCAENAGVSIMLRTTDAICGKLDTSAPIQPPAIWMSFTFNLLCSLFLASLLVLKMKTTFCSPVINQLDQKDVFWHGHTRTWFSSSSGFRYFIGIKASWQYSSSFHKFYKSLVSIKATPKGLETPKCKKTWRAPIVVTANKTIKKCKHLTKFYSVHLFQ